MAITVVQAAQSAGAANSSTAALGSVTAGNTIVSFFSQTGTNTPSIAGYTINGTNAAYSISSTLWVAYKIAAGGETNITWTAGASATGRGACAWEIAGAASSITLDGSPVKTDNIGSGSTGTTPTVTTTVPGSIVLIGEGGDASTGAISAWTGTNAATNIGTAAARCMGGSFITTTPIASTFTANWANSRVSAIMAIAFQPPVVASGLLPRLTLLGVGLWVRPTATSSEAMYSPVGGSGRLRIGSATYVESS